MSQAQLEAFMAKVKNDKSLQEQLKGAATSDAAAAIAKAAGFHLTAQEFAKHSAHHAAHHAQELTHAELEGIAGGVPLPSMVPADPQICGGD